MIVAAFPLSACRPCPVRAFASAPSAAAATSPCTPDRYRKPSTPPAPNRPLSAWRDQYLLRCGIEATIHQAATTTGLRHARYCGVKKVHLEHIVSAIAVNLIWLNTWWNSHSL